MKTDYLAISVGLSLALTLACSRKVTPKALPNGYTIHVGKIDNKCFLDIKGLNLWLPYHPTVQWVSDDNETYTVDFEEKVGLPNPSPGTPFDDDTGHAKHQLTTKEGSRPPKRNGDYLYSVKDGSGNPCIDPKDPGIYVKP